MDNVTFAVEAARQAAVKATEEFLAKYGDRDACGFAWVDIPVSGNTKIGRALKKAGIRKNYCGKGFQWWNPSESYTQAITAKEVGAEAAAKVLRDLLGIEAYTGSRMD